MATITKPGNHNKPYLKLKGRCLFCACEFHSFWQECTFEPGETLETSKWHVKCPECSTKVYLQVEEDV